MLTVHHLRRSQSERIVWLCEELGLDYELKCYDRNKSDMLAPPEYKALHPMGIAPVINDGSLALGESGAIVEYILARYGSGGLTRGPTDPEFAHYLYWLHFANGTLQPIMGRMMTLHRLDVPAEHPLAMALRARLALVLVAGRGALRASAVPGGRRAQRGRHHERVLAYDHANLLPAGSRALPTDRGVPAAADRDPRWVSSRHAEKGDPEMTPMLG
jgi:glutathione S-transferase